MVDNKNEAFKYYCENEIEDIKKLPLYIELCHSVEAKGLTLVSDYGPSSDKKDKNIYLGVTIFDKNGNLVDIYDEGTLAIATPLITIDKKERVMFFSWNDEDFIDSIKWMINEVNKY